MGLTVITYQTRLVYGDQNIWLQELDKWLIKLLNKRAKVTPQTHEFFLGTERREAASMTSSSSKNIALNYNYPDPRKRTLFPLHGGSIC